MDEQALPGESEGLDSRGKPVRDVTKKLLEGLELLENSEMRDCADFTKRQRERCSWKAMLIWMKEEHASWEQERKSMEQERKSMEQERKSMEQERKSMEQERKSMEAQLRKLQSEVEQLRSSRPISDVDRGSEEIDLKPLLEEKWIAARQALAPITPEAVRARTPCTGVGDVAAFGKENAFSHRKNGESAEEEIEHLRRQNKRLQEKMEKLTKENRSFKNQYHSVVKARSGTKGDGGQGIPFQNDLQAALEKADWDQPSKIRRHSLEGALMQGGDCSTPRPASPHVNAPSTPVPRSGTLPSEAVSVVIPGPSASMLNSGDAQAKVKAEPVEFEPSKSISQIPLTNKNPAGGVGGGLKVEPDRSVDNSGTPTAVANSKKRPPQPSGNQSAKRPAFKFVEPVRKKAERENLQGTECKLCKKFYDAVQAGDAQGMAESRCNHLDKSRHRFRDLPPATPEGFWNIGFDSEF